MSARLILEEGLASFGRFLSIHRKPGDQSRKQADENKALSREVHGKMLGNGRPVEHGEQRREIESWDEDTAKLVESE